MPYPAHSIDRGDDATGSNLCEHLAGVHDLLPAVATFAAAVNRWPGAKLTLRNGARILEKTAGGRLNEPHGPCVGVKNGWRCLVPATRQGTRSVSRACTMRSHASAAHSSKCSWGGPRPSSRTAACHDVCIASERCVGGGGSSAGMTGASTSRTGRVSRSAAERRGIGAPNSALEQNMAYAFATLHPNPRIGEFL